jgi:hypothetical protein
MYDRAQYIQYDVGAYRGDTVGEAMRVSISGVSGSHSLQAQHGGSEKQVEFEADRIVTREE